VKAALLRVNLIDGRSFKVPLTPEWRALMAGIEDRYRSKKVQCIASYASAKGVAPDGVDDEFSANVLVALEADPGSCTRTLCGLGTRWLGAYPAGRRPC
jgi:hypothetical protein